jgi:hypothetical protein
MKPPPVDVPLITAYEIGEELLKGESIIPPKKESDEEFDARVLKESNDKLQELSKKINP